MTRRAILIETSQLQDHPDLPGARIDVANWTAFLRSYEGGAWNDDEITTLSKPSWAVLQARLQLEKSTDYVFVTFSGHGYHPEGKDNDETRICLNERDEIPVRQLSPDNPRCTVVIDACRQLVKGKALLEAFSVKEMVRSAAFRDRLAYREVFDSAVAQAERGVIRLFSCSVEESANESPTSGGYYTDALLGCCSKWHDRAEKGKRLYYSVWPAHECAVANTTLRESRQHPEFNGGRRNKYFPLAVKP